MAIIYLQNTFPTLQKKTSTFPTKLIKLLFINTKACWLVFCPSRYRGFLHNLPERHMKIFLLLFVFSAFNVVGGTFLLNDYNLITLGDFSSNSEVEGKTFVGGDLIGNQSHNFGIKLTSPYDGPTSQVAGNVAVGSPLSVKGGMKVGLNNNVQWGSQTKINNRHINNVDWVASSDLDSIRDSYALELKSNSQEFRDMASNSNVTIPSGQPSGYKFNVNQSLGSNDYAVFDIGQWGLFKNTKVQQIEMLANNISSLAGIIINIGGVNANWSNSGNMVGSIFTSLAGREKILWNFYEAETIQLHAHSFMGSILAPYATVTSANPIEGSLGVLSLLTTSEVHLPNSVIETTVISVPEPNTKYLMVIALFLMYLRLKLFRAVCKHE